MGTQRQGFCKYCGQSKMIEAGEDMSQEIVDEMVTEDCNCDGAAKARSRKNRLEKIENFVSEHFSDKTQDFVKDAISLIENGIWEKISFNYGHCQCAIWLDANGYLRIRIHHKTDEELKV